MNTKRKKHLLTESTTTAQDDDDGQLLINSGKSDEFAGQLAVATGFGPRKFGRRFKATGCFGWSKQRAAKQQQVATLDRHQSAESNETTTEQEEYREEEEEEEEVVVEDMMKNERPIDRLFNYYYLSMNSQSTTSNSDAAREGQQRPLHLMSGAQVRSSPPRRLNNNEHCCPSGRLISTSASWLLVAILAALVASSTCQQQQQQAQMVPGEVRALALETSVVEEPAASVAPRATELAANERDLLMQLLQSTSSLHEANQLLESLILGETEPRRADYTQVRASLGSEQSPATTEAEPPIRVHLPEPLAKSELELLPGKHKGLLDEILEATARGTSQANRNVLYDDDQTSTAAANSTDTSQPLASLPISAQQAARLLAASKQIEYLMSPPRAQQATSLTANNSAPSNKPVRTIGGEKDEDGLSNNESISSMVIRAGNPSRKLIANYSHWINHETHTTPGRILTPVYLKSSTGQQDAIRFIEPPASMTTSVDRPYDATVVTAGAQGHLQDQMTSQTSSMMLGVSLVSTTPMPNGGPITVRPKLRPKEFLAGAIKQASSGVKGGTVRQPEGKSGPRVHKVVLVNAMPSWMSARTRIGETMTSSPSLTSVSRTLVTRPARQQVLTKRASSTENYVELSVFADTLKPTTPASTVTIRPADSPVQSTSRRPVERTTSRKPKLKIKRGSMVKERTTSITPASLEIVVTDRPTTGTTEIVSTTATAETSTSNVRTPAARLPKSLNLAHLLLGTSSLLDHMPTTGEARGRSRVQTWSSTPSFRALVEQSTLATMSEMPTSSDAYEQTSLRTTEGAVFDLTTEASTTTTTTSTTEQSAAQATDSQWRAVEQPLRVRSVGGEKRNKRLEQERQSLSAKSFAKSPLVPDERRFSSLIEPPVTNANVLLDLNRLTLKSLFGNNQTSTRRSTVTTSTLSPIMDDEGAFDAKSSTDYSQSQRVLPLPEPTSPTLAPAPATTTTTTTESQPIYRKLAEKPRQQQVERNVAKWNLEQHHNRSGSFGQRLVDHQQTPINHQIHLDIGQQMEPTGWLPPTRLESVDNHRQPPIAGGRPLTGANEQPLSKAPTFVHQQLAANDSSLSSGLERSGFGSIGQLGPSQQQVASPVVAPPDQESPTTTVSSVSLPEESHPTSERDAPGQVVNGTEALDRRVSLLHLSYGEPELSSSRIGGGSLRRRSSTTLAPEFSTAPFLADGQLEGTTKRQPASTTDPLPSILFHNRLSSLFQYKLANRSALSPTAKAYPFEYQTKESSRPTGELKLDSKLSSTTGDTRHRNEASQQVQNADVTVSSHEANLSNDDGATADESNKKKLLAAFSNLPKSNNKAARLWRRDKHKPSTSHRIQFVNSSNIEPDLGIIARPDTAPSTVEQAEHNQPSNNGTNGAYPKSWSPIRGQQDSNNSIVIAAQNSSSLPEQPAELPAEESEEESEDAGGVAAEIPGSLAEKSADWKRDRRWRTKVVEWEMKNKRNRPNGNDSSTGLPATWPANSNRSMEAPDYESSTAESRPANNDDELSPVSSESPPSSPPPAGEPRKRRRQPPGLPPISRDISTTRANLSSGSLRALEGQQSPFISASPVSLGNLFARLPQAVSPYEQQPLQNQTGEGVEEPTSDLPRRVELEQPETELQLLKRRREVKKLASSSTTRRPVEYGSPEPPLIPSQEAHLQPSPPRPSPLLDEYRTKSLLKTLINLGVPNSPTPTPFGGTTLKKSIEQIRLIRIDKLHRQRQFERAQQSSSSTEPSGEMSSKAPELTYGMRSASDASPQEPSFFMEDLSAQNVRRSNMAPRPAVAASTELFSRTASSTLQPPENQQTFGSENQPIMVMMPSDGHATPKDNRLFGSTEAAAAAAATTTTTTTTIQPPSSTSRVSAIAGSTTTSSGNYLAHEETRAEPSNEVASTVPSDSSHRATWPPPVPVSSPESHSIDLAPIIPLEANNINRSSTDKVAPVGRSSQRNERHTVPALTSNEIPVQFQAPNSTLLQDSNRMSPMQRAAALTVGICCSLIVFGLLLAAVFLKCRSACSADKTEQQVRNRLRQRVENSRRIRARIDRRKSTGAEVGPTPIQVERSRSKTNGASKRMADKDKSKSGSNSALLLATDFSTDGQQCSSAESTASICMSTSSDGMNFVRAEEQQTDAKHLQAAKQPSSRVQQRPRRPHENEQEPSKASSGLGIGRFQYPSHSGGREASLRKRISGTITSRLLRMHLPRLLPYFALDYSTSQLAANCPHQQPAPAQQSKVKESSEGLTVGDLLGLANGRMQRSTPAASKLANNFHLQRATAEHQPTGHAPANKPACLPQVVQSRRHHQTRSTGASEQHYPFNSCSPSSWLHKTQTGAFCQQQVNNQQTSRTNKLPFGTASSVLRQVDTYANNGHQTAKTEGHAAQRLCRTGNHQFMVPGRTNLRAEQPACNSNNLQENLSTKHNQAENEHHLLVDNQPPDMRHHQHRIFHNHLLNRPTMDVVYDESGEEVAAESPEVARQPPADRHRRHRRSRSPAVIGTHYSQRPTDLSNSQQFGHQHNQNNEEDEESASDTYYNLEQNFDAHPTFQVERPDSRASISRYRPEEPKLAGKMDKAAALSHVARPTGHSASQHHDELEHKRTSSNSGCHCNLVLYPL